MSGKGDKSVFISYRRDAIGKCLACRTYDALQAHGYEPFMDLNLESGKWKDQLTKEIRGRAHFLLLLTPGALDDWADPQNFMRREFEEACNAKRNIVPVLEESQETTGLERTEVEIVQKILEFQITRLGQYSFKDAIQQLIEHFIPPHRAPHDPDGDSIGKRLRHAARNLAPLLNQLFAMLLLAAAMWTLAAGSSGHWEAGYSVCVVLFAGGVHRALGLPKQLQSSAIFALFVVLCGTTIIISKATKNVYPSTDLLTAGMLALSFGLGMSLVVARLTRNWYRARAY